MELKNEIRINAPRAEVFKALNDIDVLRQAIPGCEEIEALSDTEFAATVSAKVGPLKARFKGQVTLADIVPPESYTLSGEGRGGPAGHAKIRSSVRLTEAGQATLLSYEVKADIGGKLAQLGGQLVQNTAQKLAGQFFENFEKLIATSNVALADDAGAAIAVSARTTSDADAQGSNTWKWAAAIVGVAVTAWLLRAG